MSNSFIFKTDRPWPNARLREGVIIGHTTATTAKIWVRTGLTGEFTLYVYPSSKDTDGEFRRSLTLIPFSDIPAKLNKHMRQFSFELNDFSSDTTYVQTVENLDPATEYRYALYGKDSCGVARILFGQDRISDTMAYSFRTLPSDVTPFSFGFYSCHMPYSESIFGRISIDNMEMWDSFAITLARHRKSGDLSFVIAGGDQVYVDGIDGLNIWKYLQSRMRKENGVLLPSKDDMLSWYRDIYRGYWGFPQVKEVFSQYPTYMIWDDHELCDGWGSYQLKEGNDTDEMDEILGDWKNKGLTYQECKVLLDNMKASAEQVYREYQHSHNPNGATPDALDYFFNANGAAFYFQDGRGNRDINRSALRILGQSQLKRFESWLESLDPAKTPFVFIISAVPVLHLKSALIHGEGAIPDLANMEDDLRDAWEHKLHNTERKRMVNSLFKAAERGLKVCILSGDVHVSAAFRLTSKSGAVIYQLTSSAITYTIPQVASWVLGEVTEDRGESPDGYSFTRLARYTDRNYALVEVNAKTGKAIFKLYGMQSITHPDRKNSQPVTDSMANIELLF